MDTIGIVLLLGLTIFATRTYLLVVRHKELSQVKLLWQPVAVGAFLSCFLIIEDILLNDVLGNEQLFEVAFGATVILAGINFFFVFARLNNMWKNYSKKIELKRDTTASDFKEIKDRLEKDGNGA